jgi:hypothetical protein
VEHEERRMFEKRGHVNEAQYLAAEHGMDAKEARRLAHDGRVLARHPHVAAAFAGGLMGTGRLRLLLRAAVGLTAKAFDDDEEELTARVVAASSAHKAERIVAEWREEVLADGTPPKDTEDRVDVAQIFDIGLIDARLHGENREAVMEELDRLTDGVHRADKLAGLTRSVAQQRADALVLMAKRSASAGRLATRPLVAMVMTHEQWTTHGGATLVRTGAAVSRETVERNLCNARLCRLVMDATGRIIDMGRDARCNTEDQRLARIIRDGTCVFGECTTPAGDCEGHHAEVDWIKGGRTDLDEMGSVCPRHHHFVHELHWTLRRHADGSWTATSPEGLTLHRPPRAGPGQLAM